MKSLCFAIYKTTPFRSILTLGACLMITTHAVSAPLPSPTVLQHVVDDAYTSYKNQQGGRNADYIPYLANVPSSLFAVVIATVDGKVYQAGDSNYAFGIESISKLFTASLVMHESGPDAILQKIGVEPTGMPFNSVLAVECEPARSVNPSVNAGAMTAVSLVKSDGQLQKWKKWKKILSYYSHFAGEKLAMCEELYQSEASCNEHNCGIAELLYSYGRLYADPLETCDVYTRQCSVLVTSRQLAIMGATLANGGVNPITKQRCVDAAYIPRLLAMAMMTGFYDESGTWAWQAGVPSKTGVGGGIVSIIPGEMAIVGFSPPLDSAGNSVRGASAIRFIVNKLGLNLFGTGK